MTILACPVLVYPGNYPFPQNFTYPYGIRATNANTATLSTRYTQWKSTYVTSSGCPANGLRVQRPSNGYDTVSEGIGYGMVIAVYFDDQTTFNGLWVYKSAHNDSNGLMNWNIASDGSTAGANAATDGDEDIAFALIEADKQWGSGGTYNYLSLAQAEIGKIKSKETDATNHYVKPGDAWDSYEFPAYYMPAYYDLFGEVTSDAAYWAAVKATCLSHIQSARNTSYGLVPTNINHDGTRNGNSYDYDSCRTPWRYANDYVWWGSSGSQGEINLLASFFSPKGAANVVDGYAVDTGNATGSNHNAAFVGPAGCSLMTSSTYQASLNSFYSYVEALDVTSGYYQGCIQMITLLLMSGNLPDFRHMFTPTSTPTINLSATKTRTPTVTPTFTITPVPPPTNKLDLEVEQASTGNSSCTGQMTINIKVINNDTVAIPIASVTVRVWLNTTKTLTVEKYDGRVYNSAGTDQGTFSTVAGAQTTISTVTYGGRTTNTYVDISFSGGPDIPAGGGWLYFNGIVRNSDWSSPLDASCNSYSQLPSTYTSYTDDPHFNLREGTYLVCEYTNSTTQDANTGVDPTTGGNGCGAAPTATPTYTRTPLITYTFTPTYTRTSTFTSTFTATPTSTFTATPTYTRTATPSFTSTFTAAVTNTFTATPSYTRTGTPTMTPTRTNQPTSTFTATQTVTRTFTPVPTSTFTMTPTFTRSATPSFTRTFTTAPTGTFTATPSMTQTFSQTATKTFTPTFTPSVTRTITPTWTTADTSTFTATPTFTVTRTFTNTYTPTFTPTATKTITDTPSSNTPTSTLTSTDTFTVTPSHTASPTATDSRTRTATPTATPSSTQTFTPSFTATFTASTTPTFTRTATMSFTPSVTATSTPTFSATMTYSSTPTWSVSATPTFTATDSYTATPTCSVSPTMTDTPTLTITDTPSSNTPTATKTYTDTFTATQTASSTATQTSTTTPPDTPTFTATWTPVITDTATGTPTAVDTASVTSTPAFTGTPTPQDTATATPAATDTCTPQPTFTASQQPSSTWTATRVQSMTATPTRTPLSTSTTAPTATFTTTVQLSATATPTVVFMPPGGSISVYNTYPMVNPFNPDRAPFVNVYFEVSKGCTTIKFRLYTAGYRLIRQEEFTGIFMDGANAVQVGSGVFKTLAPGIYYYAIIASGPDRVGYAGKAGKIIIVRDR